MAKKRTGRRRKALVVGQINPAAGIALGTLGNNTLISVTTGENPVQEMWLMSVDLTWGMQDLTVGEGPILVGVAHEDYTDTEIEEYLENTGSWNPSKLIEKERAGRKVRVAGLFAGQLAQEYLNDGKPIRTRCGWRNAENQSLKLWAYNRGGGTLTTGAIIRPTGQAYLTLA